MNILRTWPGQLLLTSCLLAACRQAKTPEAGTTPRPITRVVGVARIEPEPGLITVYAGASGRVKTISAAENEAVAQGQTLLTLDSQPEAAQLREARAKIGTQRAAIAAQEVGLETIKLNAAKAQADYELNQQLYTAKGITRQTLDDSRTHAGQKRQEYQKGVADLAQTRSVLNELDASVHVYAARVSEKTLLAPYTGKLLEWTVKVGDYVTGNAPVGQLAPEGPLIARTEVDELFADRIRLGQRADIRSQATGQVIGSGTVQFAGGFLKRKSLFEDETAQEDRRVREVRIRLNPGGNLLINGRVDCIIHLN